MSEDLEGVAVEAVQPILCRRPDVPVVVLEEGPDGILGKAVLRGDPLKFQPLHPSPEGKGEKKEKSSGESELFPLHHYTLLTMGNYSGKPSPGELLLSSSDGRPYS